MKDKNDVASLHSSKREKKALWKKAIKWPLYSVAVMPVVLAAGWKYGAGENLQFDQIFGFLIASILLLIWENLTNDLFDETTGVDKFKLHSVIALTGKRKLIRNLANLILGLGLGLIFLLSLRSHFAVFYLILGSCLLGYLYQGPPFRLGYQGLGEPLCWLAFGPLATAAALLVISPNIKNIPWGHSFTLGSGPAVATTLVLFCANFHQVLEDSAHGKKTLLVLLGTKRAAQLVPWFVILTLGLELIPVVNGHWPITALLGAIGLPPAIALIRLLNKYHNKPSLISESKFLALRFQTLNGLGISLGLALDRFI